MAEDTNGALEFGQKKREKKGKQVATPINVNR